MQAFLLVVLGDMQEVTLYCGLRSLLVLYELTCTRTLNEVQFTVRAALRVRSYFPLSYKLR